MALGGVSSAHRVFVSDEPRPSLVYSATISVPSTESELALSRTRHTVKRYAPLGKKFLKFGRLAYRRVGEHHQIAVIVQQCDDFSNLVDRVFEAQKSRCAGCLLQRLLPRLSMSSLDKSIWRTSNPASWNISYILEPSIDSPWPDCKVCNRPVAYHLQYSRGDFQLGVERDTLPVSLAKV